MRPLLNLARRRIVPVALRPRILPLIVVRNDPAVLWNVALTRLRLSFIGRNVAEATNPVPFEHLKRACNLNERTRPALTTNDTGRLSAVRPEYLPAVAANAGTLTSVNARAMAAR